MDSGTSDPRKLIASQNRTYPWMSKGDAPPETGSLQWKRLMVDESDEGISGTWAGENSKQDTVTI